MRTEHRVAFGLAALLVAGSALADDKPAPASASAPTSNPPAEPAVQRIVTEDDNVRIEELRVRGQTQSIVVRNKAPGAGVYEIVPSSGANDPSLAPGASGQRVWHLFDF
jgi:hypothetical protein